MDTTDRNDSHLPARLPSSSALPPAMAGAYRSTYDLATAAPTVQISPQGILRGLARNWWRILLLWLGVATPLVLLIYTQVEPTYEAYSMIRAEPAQHGLFTPDASMANAQSIERYIDTQQKFITSDRVLKAAMADNTVVNLPFIKNSKTPLKDLKEKLQVKNDGKTYFISVQFESTNAAEAAAIVNAVVSSYLRNYSDQKEGSDAKLTRSLQNYLLTLKADKDKKEADLLKLVDDGRFDPTPLTAGNDRKEPTKGQGGEQDPATSTKDLTTIEQYRSFKARILEKEYEKRMLQYALQKRLAETQEQDDVDAEASGEFQKEQLETRIRDVFRRDPAVASLISEIVATEDEVEHTKNVARKGQDPARTAGEKRAAQLRSKYNDLWNERYDELRKVAMSELASGGNSGNGPVSPKSLTTEELRAHLEDTQHQLDSLNAMLQTMEIEKKASQSDAYRADRLKADIDTLRSQYDLIYRKLEDLKFTTNKDLVRVELVDPADELKSPTNNKRFKFMIAAGGMVLCLVLGLFALLEVKAERVGDPDALSTRVQSEVFSLPPLPMVRASARLNGPAEDDQIDRFIQRLDHLRFAVCGDHPEVGLGRCVLITSAIGGEGKTTLAAQLAARCGHAGHSTLLIDADLRRGSLCPLLDVPEGPGLSDVLKDEANVEEVVIPVQSGTFHLLCAGTPVSDTSRVFQGRNFGMLIARLRQMYDLIIIDSPPVLPVPDGLILGRWTDGAVLASRYDVSRAPQVERARRQLANAGIPVLGTVINGMRASDSYYGRYSYSRGRSGYSDPDTSAAS
jgi:polysaccharide biosynthesis transport protein